MATAGSSRNTPWAGNLLAHGLVLPTGIGRHASLRGHGAHARPPTPNELRPRRRSRAARHARDPAAIARALFDRRTDAAYHLRDIAENRARGAELRVKPDPRLTSPTGRLDRWIREEPDRTAFVFGEDTWTFRRLAAESQRLAGVLLARGVRPGDRVALHMGNRAEAIVAYYACFRAGAVAAPLNTRLKTESLRSLLQRLRPVLYLGDDRFCSQVAPVEPDVLPADARFVVGDAAGIGTVRPWSELYADAAHGEPVFPDVGRDAPLVLYPTSGTTAQPKLVIHTGATLLATGASFAHLGMDAQQTVLHALPLMHSFGPAVMLGAFHCGAPLRMLEQFEPDAVLDAIEAHGCGWLPGLPAMFANLIRHQRVLPREVGSLRHCLSSGDACPPGLQEDFARTFGVKLRSFMGFTEAGASLTFGLQPGPVSRAAPGTEIRVIDAAGGPPPPPPPGARQIRPAPGSPGYWAGPDQVEGAPEDGWFHTGDLVRRGAGDDVWYVARRKELIVRGGSNIAPAEVEHALLAHPDVRDAAVVGVPDPELGQRVGAVVQLADEAKSEAALDGIRADIASRLADYMVPALLRAVDAVPRNAMGKIDRAAALALVQETG